MQQQKEHLEFILQAHEALCKVKLMAPNVLSSASLPIAAAKCIVAKEDAEDQEEQAAAVSAAVAKRPSSLVLTPQANSKLPPKKKRM